MRAGMIFSAGHPRTEAHGPRHTRPYAPSGLETVASVSLTISGALRSSSSLLSISLVEPIPKHQKDMDKLPVLSLGPIHVGRHARARARMHANACPPTKDVYIPGSGLLALKGLIRFVVSLFCFSRVTSSFFRLPTVCFSATLPDFRRQQRPCGCPTTYTPDPKPSTPEPNSDGSNGPAGARHATAAAYYADKDSQLTNAACVAGTHLR